MLPRLEFHFTFNSYFTTSRFHCIDVTVWPQELLLRLSFICWVLSSQESTIKLLSTISRGDKAPCFTSMNLERAIYLVTWVWGDYTIALCLFMLWSIEKALESLFEFMALAWPSSGFISKQHKQGEFTHVGLMFDSLLGLAVIVSCSPVTPYENAY